MTGRITQKITDRVSYPTLVRELFIGYYYNHTIFYSLLFCFVLLVKWRCVIIANQLRCYRLQAWSCTHAEPAANGGADAIHRVRPARGYCWKWRSAQSRNRGLLMPRWLPYMILQLFFSEWKFIRRRRDDTLSLGLVTPKSILVTYRSTSGNFAVRRTVSDESQEKSKKRLDRND